MTPLEWAVIGALLGAIVGGVGALFAKPHADRNANDRVDEAEDTER